MKQHDNSNNLTDEQLRAMLHTGLPQRIPSPWFTRKVMNRLPPRRTRITALVEYALYIAGIIITAIEGYSYVTTTLSSGIITVANAITISICAGLLVGLCYLTIAPFVIERSLADEH